MENTLENAFQKRQLQETKDHLILLMRLFMVQSTQAHMGSTYIFYFSLNRKTWVYFLKEKAEVFGAFKRFKAIIEEQSGYKMKAMRTDRGGEFTSKNNVKKMDSSPSNGSKITTTKWSCGKEEPQYS